MLSLKVYFFLELHLKNYDTVSKLLLLQGMRQKKLFVKPIYLSQKLFRHLETPVTPKYQI